MAELSLEILENMLGLLSDFLTAGVVLLYDHGELSPWPQASVTPEIKSLIRKHRAELCALLATPIARIDHYSWAVRRRYYDNHGVNGLDAFELVSARVFEFSEVRHYYLMERHYRPPN
jgi:hypothetical protein